MRRPFPIALITTAVVVGGGLAWAFLGPKGADAEQEGPTVIADQSAADVDLDPSESRTAAPAQTMATVLEMAADARKHMVATLDDYTARFVKQERDSGGTLSEKSEIFMKVQTRHRGGQEGTPMRVYLRFDSPSNVKGREVIWGADIYDGNMQVREAGFVGGMMTVSLDPNGMIAMQGQRYPITEIGMTKLVDKLLERGEVDRDNPDVTVAFADGQKFDGLDTQLIQVKRAKPSGEKDDFSIAEIVIDPDRQLILSYRSYGWPEEGDSEAPLLESYAFHDVKTNVGLTDADFDTKNADYTFK